MNPLPKRAGNEWTRDLKKGEHILWACANPKCVDKDGKRTVFDRGENMRGSDFCPRCRRLMEERLGKELDPALQAEVDALEQDDSPLAARNDHEDSVQARAEGYRWKRERINPKLASRWLDLFME